MLTNTFNKSMQDDITYVLWTGGWDSTYRVIELSRQNTTIQPIYVYGDERKSEKYEIQAMRKISSLVKEKKETKATFLPILFIDKNSIPLNQEITKAYNEISRETNLGSQHEWLARLAYCYPGLEIGTEAATSEVSNILKAINKYGKLIKLDNEDNYVLSLYESSEEGILVFGNFKFPIIKKNGQIMKKNIESWGYNDVMKNVWVCHTPLYGKTCGLCHPCELKIETGMDFLLTSSALKRYKRNHILPFKILYKIEMKVVRKLSALGK